MVKMGALHGILINPPPVIVGDLECETLLSTEVDTAHVWLKIGTQNGTLATGNMD